jgi:Integron Cassette Protein Hfx_Cass5
MPTENFAHIYRDASGVAWLENGRSLAAREPQKWTHVELFKQILAAIRNEYGQALVFAPETRWNNVPSELQNELRSCA